jgi:hypothetical protein
MVGLVAAGRAEEISFALDAASLHPDSWQTTPLFTVAGAEMCDITTDTKDGGRSFTPTSILVRFLPESGEYSRRLIKPGEAIARFTEDKSTTRERACGTPKKSTRA